MTIFSLSILFVAFGQLLNALIVLIDKHIVTSTEISKPSSYAFYVGLLSSVVLVMLPFGVVTLPDTYTIVISIIIGLVFIASLVFLFSALKIASAIDVVTWLAATSTIATFFLGSLFLIEDLPNHFPYALTLFVIGMLLVGHFRFNAKSFLYVLIAGFFFGLSTVLIKLLFDHTESFADGFFWSRMGNVFGALLLLLLPSVRSGIIDSSKKATNKTGALVILNRLLGGVAFISILYAIRLGSVSIVNALASLQFIFLFLLIFFGRKIIPDIYNHEFRPGHVAHKVAAMIFIALGFLALFL